MFDQTCIVLKSGSSSTMGPTNLLSSYLVSVSPPTATAKPMASSHHFTPLPSFSCFVATCIKLCGLPPSLVRNTRLCCLVYRSLKCRKYQVVFPVKMNIKSSIIFADTVDGF